MKWYHVNYTERQRQAQAAKKERLRRHGFIEHDGRVTVSVTDRAVHRNFDEAMESARSLAQLGERDTSMPAFSRPRELSDNAHQYALMLVRDRGYKYLAQGAFSIVLEEPGGAGVALKIGPTHDGWLAWAQHCRMAHKYNSFFLKVYSVQRHDSEGFYEARIEKCHMTMGEAQRDIPENDRWRNNIDVSAFYTHVSGKYEKNYPGLRSALEEVNSLSMSTGISMDLHAENVMLRPDGSMCITDPFSYPMKEFT